MRNHKIPKYDFYFASPFFNEEQVEREEFLKKALRDAEYTVFSPKENVVLKPNASFGEQHECFEDNIKSIQDSCCLFVVTDGKDVGTIWEAGFGYGSNKPIIYYCETLPKGGKFNVMLAQSGIRTITSREELLSLLKSEEILEPSLFGGYIE